MVCRVGTEQAFGEVLTRPKSVNAAKEEEAAVEPAYDDEPAKLQNSHPCSLWQ
jgi:hypothetical protein